MARQYCARKLFTIMSYCTTQLMQTSFPLPILQPAVLTPFSGFAFQCVVYTVHLKDGSFALK